MYSNTYSLFLPAVLMLPSRVAPVSVTWEKPGDEIAGAAARAAAGRPRAKPAAEQSASAQLRRLICGRNRGTCLSSPRPAAVSAVPFLLPSALVLHLRLEVEHGA